MGIVYSRGRLSRGATSSATGSIYRNGYDRQSPSTVKHASEFSKRALPPMDLEDEEQANAPETGREDNTTGLQVRQVATMNKANDLLGANFDS